MIKTCIRQAGSAATEIVGFPRLAEPTTRLSIGSYPPASPNRDRLEAFVRDVFLHAYQARIRSFYPHLLSITRPDDSFAAVAGMRPADTDALFAEQYLDQPIEQILAGHGYLVPRESIVEVGNLAPASAGQARWLITALTAYLHAAGFSWVVFTAVPALHNAFQRLGLPLIELAPAEAHRLDASSQDEWGQYYQSKPMVYAGHILAGYNSLNRLIDPRLTHLQQLWDEAQQAGALFRLQQRTGRYHVNTSA